jgi:hypothetical protein
MGASVAWLAASGAGPRRTGFAGQHAATADDFADRTWAGDDLMDRAWGAGRGITRNPDETEANYRSRVAEARAQVLGAARNAQETAEAFGDRVEEMMMTARQRAASGWSRLAEGAGSASAGASERGRQLGDAANRAGSQFSGTANRAADSVMRAGGAAMQTGGTVVDTIGGNPVLLGALGMVAGAVLGAVMPLTRYEEEMLREPARRAGGAARDMAGEAINRGTEAVRSATQAGYSTLREQRQAPPQGANPAARGDTPAPMPEDATPGFDAGAAGLRH